MWTSTSSQEQALEIPNSSNRRRRAGFPATSSRSAWTSQTAIRTHSPCMARLRRFGAVRADPDPEREHRRSVGHESISNFANGVYLQWDVSGDVVITVTCTAGKNAVIGGLFFDAGPTRRTAGYVKTTRPRKATGRAPMAVKATTSSAAVRPDLVTVTPESESTCMWTSTSSQDSGLETPLSTNRVAASGLRAPASRSASISPTANARHRPVRARL